GVAQPGDHPALLQAIQEPGDVRSRAHQPLADLAAGQTLLAGAAQDAQRVVLRRREIVAPEGSAQRLEQEARRALQSEERLLLQAGERLLLMDLLVEGAG